MDEKQLLKAQIISDLYKTWSPHKGQKEILKWVFKDGVKRILAINGRNWGKTESGIHVPTRCGLTREGLHPSIKQDDVIDSYYIAPNILHARRIVWDNRRLFQMVPKKYILDVNKADRMIYLTIDGQNCCAWIKVEGAENIWSLVGVKHKGPMIIDELYMIDRGFLEAHEEDLAAWQPPLLQFSTWPKSYPHWIDKMAKEYQQTPEWRFMQQAGTENPNIEQMNPGYFLKQKERYAIRGDLIGYQREILSLRVFGGSDTIFPEFNCRTYIKATTAGFQDEETLEIANRDVYREIMSTCQDTEHVVSHETILKMISKDRHHLQAIIAADPGHASRFAILFCMLNPYTKDLYFLGEIYEGDRNKITTSKMMERVVEKTNELWPHIIDTQEIRKVCDEAALWFRMECVSVTQNEKGITKGQVWSWVPTSKSEFKHEYGFSQIKSAMNLNKFHISDECPWFIWEILNYKVETNRKGQDKIPTKNDHLIDDCRYILAAFNYQIDEHDIPAGKELGDDFDAISMRSEMAKYHEERSEDWGDGEVDSWGE